MYFVNYPILHYDKYLSSANLLQGEGGCHLSYFKLLLGRLI